jgi:uncharacterized membrane protein YfcA
VTILGFALATLIGLSLGLLGGGGSILTVPVLHYVLGFEPKPAIAMSLPVVGVTSLFGAVAHWRKGNVRFGTAVEFGLLAMLGAYAGARLSVHVSGAVQLTLLAIVMFAAAMAMFRGRRADVADSDARTHWALLVPISLSLGLLTGVVGIGGGFLIVPALVVLARVPMREAIGTSLLVITMNSTAGFAGYLGTVDFEWRFLAGFAACAIAGALAGTAIAGKVPQATLRRAFAVFLVLMSVFMLVERITGR